MVALASGVAAVILAYLVYVFASDSYVPGMTRTWRVLSDLALLVRDSHQLPLMLVGTVLALLGFIIVMARIAARQVLRPVGRLAEAARRLGQGDLRIRLSATGADELADLVDTFNQMATALERTVRELRRLEERSRRFAGDVSHELRTPLAAMLAVTELLDEQSECFAGDAGAAARLVSAETKNLNRLVADLIEVSRFDAGTAALVADVVDLAEAVARCLHARGWSGEVACEIEPKLAVRVDPRRLDVIIANLVGNALRHGAQPVALQATSRATVGGPWVFIEVSDGGAGLPPEVLPHVFERFYKADAARGRSEGSGLGLAIAWENARLHGGVIEVANRPEGGALFTVGLPMA